MATGRNSVTGIAIQSGRGAEATELDAYNCTSNSMEIETNKTKSEAYTGSRIVRNQFTSTEDYQGDLSFEYTLESFPALLKLAGFDEESAPSNFNTIIDGDGTNTTTVITPVRIFGFKEGDSITVSGESDTIKNINYKTKEITLDTGLTTAPTGGDSVINESRYEHEFVFQNTIDYYGTVLKWLKDEQYYEKYIDCKANSMDISFAQGAYLTGSINMVGLGAKYDTTNPSDTVNNLPDIDNILKSYGTEVYLGTTAYSQEVDDMSFSFNNNIDTGNRGVNHIGLRDVDAQGTEITSSFTLNFNKQYRKELLDLSRGDQYFSLEVYNNSGLGIVFEKASMTSNNASTDTPDRLTMSGDFEILQGDNYTVKFLVVDEKDTQY